MSEANPVVEDVTNAVPNVDAKEQEY